MMLEKLLLLLDPERAHSVGKWAMKRGLGAPGVSGLDFSKLGLGLNGRGGLGLAAGFDKNGELVDKVREYDFGWVEVGSVTARGGIGNTKPRLFRLPDGGLMNRMGLNGDPVDVVRGRLVHADQSAFGVNIAKTHDPEIVGDRAIADMLYSYHALCNLGLYTVLNISCPNTREGKTFEEIGALRELLSEVMRARLYHNSVPLFLKLSPCSPLSGEDLVRVVDDFNVRGFVLANTLPFESGKFGKGGLSGPRLFMHTVDLIKRVRSVLPETMIMACGGIDSGYALRSYRDAGADLFQAYAGFVRGRNSGPKFVSNVVKEFNKCVI